jgi:thermitase
MRKTWSVAALACAAVLSCAVSASAATYGYDAHTVIVQFKPGTTTAQKTAALGGAPVVSTINGLGADVARVAVDPAVAATALNRLAVVRYAEVNKILRTSAIPNDPRFGELYGLNNTGQTGGTPDADIDAPEGWDAAGLGTFPSTGGVKVGVVDTGILATHEDLTGKLANCAQSRGIGGILAGSIREGSCADDNGHGTHVSGTITGNANNGKGVAGVAFNSQLAMCRALGGPLGSGSTSDVANCITWLSDKGASVISMSLGGGDSTTLHNAVQYAWKSGNGALIVAAAGNDGDSTLEYPAAYAEVVSVAATDNKDQRASFSNANADVEVAAPGVDVLSSYNGSNSDYETLSGTSMATPHVAGVGAIIRDRNPAFTAAQARSKLDASVDDLGTAGRDQQFGFGRVNLVKAAS